MEGLFWALSSRPSLATAEDMPSPDVGKATDMRRRFSKVCEKAPDREAIVVDRGGPVVAKSLHPLINKRLHGGLRRGRDPVRPGFARRGRCLAAVVKHRLELADAGDPAF